LINVSGSCFQKNDVKLILLNLRSQKIEAVLMNRHTKYSKLIVVTFFVLNMAISAFAQNKPSSFVNNSGQLNYSSLDNWYSRKLKESVLLSGNTIELYGVGKVDAKADLFDLKLKDPVSPWGTTNVFAKMVLDVGNTRVIPEKRGNGYCARLETKIRKDNIAGFKVDVLLSGTLFVGEMIEPVHGMKDPIKNVSQGIPFTGMPKAVKFDYKYNVGKTRVQATTNITPVDGPDKAEFALILQKRWEDKDGNVFATRIGGARQFYTGTQAQWVTGATYPVTYGDVTHLPIYDPKTMGLIPSVGEVYVKNSLGKMVPLVETGWGKPGDAPTHMILYFTSSYQGVEYIGSTESVFWVDNIELVY
jgi:hypothetical protein